MGSKNNESDEYSPIESFDDIWDSSYGVLPDFDGIRYRMHDMIEYAQLKGVSTEELTEDEIAKFTYKVDTHHKFFITDEQQDKLKKILTQEEFDNLITLKNNAFFDMLYNYINNQIHNGELTPIGTLLKDIYFEIINQSL